MDKQRLLELAGITEAKYASAEEPWIVVNIEEGWPVGAYGPFQSEQEAQGYMRAYGEEQEMEQEDIDEIFSAIQVYPPEF